VPTRRYQMRRTPVRSRWQSDEVDSGATSISEAKQALRRSMRQVRGSIVDRHGRTTRMWANAGHVCDAVEAAVGRPLCVLAFVGVGNEPDTSALIALLHLRGHSVLLPRMEGEHLVAVTHTAGDELRSGAYGIPEPTGPSVEPDTIDLVIVPGLAFTADGRRLGQGGGFYDRFLPLVRPDCVTCGVGFAEQIVDDLPLEPHDRPLRMLLTA